mgnify:CR=1 FL=1
MGTWRQRLAQIIAGTPKRAAGRGVRMYGGARLSEGQLGFGSSSSSADAELSMSLERLRNRSRQLVRDSAYAKRAKTVVINNVIGSGVGMQAQVMNTRGALAQSVNDSIEAAWREWSRADSCHTGGALAFGDLERALMGEVFESGEVLVRLHFRAFGASRVPVALELVEGERLADHVDVPGVASGNELRMGVEVDRYGRAVAYHIRGRHRGDMHVRVGERSDFVERVPAEQILHLKLTHRWPQTRGEPWLHTVVRKLHDMEQYTSAEVAAAKASAFYFATVQKPDDGNPLTNATTEDGRPVMELEPLSVQELAPGEELKFHTPNRPNVALDPFLRYMLREVSAGVGVSYESLSRDYSQSNYSSSRLALLDDRDTWRALQHWWIRCFREPLHRVWLRQAVLARAVASVPVEAYATDSARYEAVKFKPRGWSWVDPTKEVAAYKEAIKAGLTTATDVIAATAGGLDIEDVLATRERELAMAAEHGLKFDVDPDAYAPAPAPALAPAAEPEPDEEPDEQAARLRRIA